MSGIGGLYPGAIISSNKAVFTESVESSLIESGVVFGISTRLVVPASGISYLLIDPTAFTGVSFILLPPLFKAYGGGPIFIDLYTNPTYSGGTTIDSINFNFNSANVSEAIVKLDPVITDLGSKLPNEYSIFSVGLPATAKTGGEAGLNLAFTLNTDDTYLYRLTNQENSAADASVVTDWYEIQ